MCDLRTKRQTFLALGLRVLESVSPAHSMQHTSSTPADPWSISGLRGATAQKHWYIKYILFIFNKFKREAFLDT